MPALPTDTAALFVHQSGDPDLPCVVFLHGAGASGRMWREHLVRLADRFHCLAPDLPGFGASTRVEPRSAAATADLVAQVVAERAPGRRVHLVGLSWGGCIVHTLLATRPALVESALIDGAGLLTSRDGKAILAGVRLVAPFLHTRPVVGLFSGMIGMDDAGREDLRRASPGAFRMAFDEGFSPVVSAVELASSAPLLLVAGEHETAVRDSNAGQAALMPHALAVHVPGGRHGWLGRQPGLHVGMVEAWLTASPLPAALVHEAPSPAAEARLRHASEGAPASAGHRPAA
jgi:pimeloyl-ACP methyl ester carboxylesterase